MKVIIEGTPYDMQSLERMTLRDIILLEQQTGELGRRLSMGDLKAMEGRLAGCKTNEDREAHPDAPWLLAVAIWIARRNAGEAVTFGEAIDFPMSQMQFELTPEEREAAEHPDPTRPRQGSGVGAGLPRDRAKKASKPKSLPA